MSVLIKGMKMPYMCSECDFCGSLIMPDNIYVCECPVDGMHGQNITRAMNEDCRHPNCPLSDVPAPHGRLIDADKCEVLSWNKDIEHQYGDDFSGGVMWMLEQLDKADTVIEKNYG